MKTKSIVARLLLVLAIATAAAVTSCVKFDDSEIQDELTNIKSRLSALEDKVNTDISGLWEVVNAQKNGITITSVSETDDSWIIVFSNGKTATVSKGGTASAPAIGVKKDSDGVYYWTLYGQWLLDDGGNKLPVSGTPGTPGAPGSPGESGITPQLKIDGGYWYVSTDGGASWTKLDKATGEDGKDGDAFFKDVTWDDDYVYLTLMDGTKIVIRRGAGLVASIAAIPDYSDGSVKAGTSIFTIRFKVEPESAAESLLYLDTDCFKLSVAYTLTKATAGDRATLPIYEMEAKDGILTILTDGEALADEFANNKLGASAALFITDGETLSVNSGYFPLYPKNEYLGHEYIDLGLESGNKFAGSNMGAENPWDAGDYYAWGELEPKDSYDWGNYKWYNSANMSMTKYNNSDGLMSFADDNYNDDVARQTWGGEWCIPTAADWEELWDKKKFLWTWTDDYLGDGSNHAGMIVTRKAGTGSSSGNSIFLPATGVRIGTVISNQASHGNYWSSFRYTDLPSVASGTGFEPGYVGLSLMARFNGCCIRPVLGKYELKTVTGVSLDHTSLTMVVGTKRHLNAKVEPESIKNPKLVWTSADASVATVAKDGTVTAVSLGTTTVTVKTVEGGYTATCTITVVNQSDIVPEYVDLGLSVKWATFNVGATKPEEFGDYFAWGETKTKSDYSWGTYKWCNGNYNNLTKYCTDASYWDSSALMDHKTVLDPEDDAAHVYWGDKWRMPTGTEFEELVNNCTWTWTDNYKGTGIAGRIVTSNKTGYKEKSIFLPAAGRYNNTNNDVAGAKGVYWSSSININMGATYDAWYNLFDHDDVKWLGYGGRFFGFSVRPVYGDFVPVSSISLDKKSLELTVNETYQMTATVSPTNATAKDVHWASSDEFIATVDKDGLVTAVAPGTATITVYASSGVSASCTVTVTPKAVEPEYVDLGLSVKWATFNVGATKPEESGDYFVWGETEPKDNISWLTYKWCNSNQTKLTKYCTKASYWDSSAPMDNKTVLDIEDDAAHANWGGSWRMPTKEEWRELMKKCTWKWTDNYNDTGIAGQVVKATNGNSIFLPAAGWRSSTGTGDIGFAGWYWSSSLEADSPDCAWIIRLYSVSGFMSHGWIRNYGMTVRPVYGEFVPVSSVSLDKTSLELESGQTAQLTASISPSNATVKEVIWATSDKSVAKVDFYGGLVTAIAPGTATITAYAPNGLSASCTVTVKEGAQAVDLGLPSGIKWASCNVGAIKPEEFGGLFSWGETETKSVYDWSAYKWGNGNWDAFDNLTKYNTDYSCGAVDYITMLLSEDDAAQANWDGNWRMPTDDDWTELRENCTWTWTDNYEGTGVAGDIVEGSNGTSIFLPAAGHGEDAEHLDAGVGGGYWSSNLDADSPDYAWMVQFESGGAYRTTGPRQYGYSVRPVTN